MRYFHAPRFAASAPADARAVQPQRYFVFFFLGSRSLV